MPAGTVEIPLPASWHECPPWWRDIVTRIRADAVNNGCRFESEIGQYLDKELLLQYGVILSRECDKGLIFSKSVDCLAFRLRYGI